MRVIIINIVKCKPTKEFLRMRHLRRRVTAIFKKTTISLNLTFDV